MDAVRNAKLIYDGDDFDAATDVAESNRPAVLRRRGVDRFEVWALGVAPERDPFPLDVPVTMVVCALVAVVAGAWGGLTGEWGLIVLGALALGALVYAEQTKR